MNDKKNIEEQDSRFHFEELTSKLKAILDSTPDYIVLIDLEFKIQTFNKVAYENCEKFHGKRLVEGNDFRKYVSKEVEEDFYENYYRALEGKNNRFEKEIEVFTSENIWLEFIFYPVFDEEKNLKGSTLLIKNITASKKHIAKIETQNKRLKEIAWTQSHVVRNPLANLMGLVNLLLMEKNNLEPDHLEGFYLNILEEAHKLDLIIRKITNSTEEDEYFN
ncbi:PAS domain S-box protein [Belliella sp. DSM 107340]|uniref:PAS domain S-box protein n=1 Tax=Belliella calami TaxID=2923436 RepID=A0ABS9ULZ3_9BACT|nr:PAS domain S-box protein [Belliella calami]MCH7397195.1 PAS domain S-box protein [Belliella calami]